MQASENTFGHARFDALCTRIQETGRASLPAFDQDSSFVAKDVLREAARVLGLEAYEYDIFVSAGSGLLTLSVRALDKF